MTVPGLQRWFPVAALLAAALAFRFPDIPATAGPAIVPLLGLVMFGMGITLTGQDFVRVLRRPVIVVLGVGLQFMVMPFLGWLLAGLAGLSAGLSAGVVLLGSCPGGTASNLICYLARGDVALSITLTAVSTLLAVLLTPVLTWAYVGERVPVPVGALLFSTAKIVLVPVTLGVLTNHLIGRRLHTVKHLFPVLSMLAIVCIIGIIVAANRDDVSLLAGSLLAVVVLHNLLGLAAGYGVPRLLGRPVTECRTLALEVGMQNSGLAVALASAHFSAQAALPGALFSIWHNLSGSMLAGRWSQRPPNDGG
jgi:BASS family bile acid:Na+ symporter